MRRGCLLIIGLAWLFSAQTALSAQSVKIYGDSGRESVRIAQQPAAASPTNAIDPSDLPGSKLTVEEIFQNLVRYFLIFIGAAAFAAMIYAGFQYIIVGGDAAKATQARRTMVLALVGILAAALSFVLVNLAANMRLSS